MAYLNMSKIGTSTEAGLVLNVEHPVVCLAAAQWFFKTTDYLHNSYH